jgi:hypothetical protein
MIQVISHHIEVKKFVSQLNVTQYYHHHFQKSVRSKPSTPRKKSLFPRNKDPRNRDTQINNHKKSKKKHSQCYSTTLTQNRHISHRNEREERITCVQFIAEFSILDCANVRC